MKNYFPVQYNLKIKNFQKHNRSYQDLKLQTDRQTVLPSIIDILTYILISYTLQ